MAIPESAGLMRANRCPMSLKVRTCVLRVMVAAADAGRAENETF